MSEPPLDRLEITLQTGDGETRRDELVQEGYEIFRQSLRDHDIKFSQWNMTFDSVDAIGFAIGTFTVHLSHRDLDLLIAALTVWIRGAPGRKAKYQNGPVHIEAQNADELRGLKELIESDRKKTD